MPYSNSMDIKKLDGLAQQKRLFFYNQIIAVITDFDTNSNYVNEDVELLYYRLVNEGTISSILTTVTKASIGLGNADNTSDLNKPVSVIQQQALDLKAPKNNPTFTGTVSGVTKAHVGLGNVDNTSDINKPISFETRQALNNKSDSGHKHDGSDITSGFVPPERLGASGTRDANAILFGDNVWRPFSVTVAGVATVNGQQGDVVVNRTTLGIDNVDNTADLDKPISTATGQALGLKADDNVTVKSVNGVTPVNGNVTIETGGGTITSDNISDATVVGKQVLTAADAGVARGAIGAGTSDLVLGTTASTAMPGNKTFTKTDVGLSNVDNTSDIDKPVSTAQQNALNLKAPINNPTFTGTVGGITKSMIGLPNVDNTSDLNKPVSTATQTALNAKLAATNGVLIGNNGTKYQTVACVLRNTGAGFIILDDSTHNPIGVTSVTQNTDSLVLNFNFTGTNAVLGQVTMDETLSRSGGYVAGCSLGLSTATIHVSQPGGIYDYISNSGSAWNASFNGIFSVTNFNTSNGLITLSHPDMGSNNLGGSVTSRSLTNRAVLDSLGTATTNVYLVNSSGTTAKTHSSDHRFWVHRSGTRTVPMTELTQTGSNLWFFAILEIA